MTATLRWIAYLAFAACLGFTAYAAAVNDSWPVLAGLAGTGWVAMGTYVAASLRQDAEDAEDEPES